MLWRSSSLSLSLSSVHNVQTSLKPLGHSESNFILFAASAFRKLSSIYAFSYFPFGFEGRIWDLIVSVPDHCLSFYFSHGASLARGNKSLYKLSRSHDQYGRHAHIW